MELKILALIPARSGSKGVPHKNIRLMYGKPLLAHSIEHARASALISRVIVSTDSVEYAAIAREYGGGKTVLRPPGLGPGFFSGFGGFEKALNWVRGDEQ